MNAAGARAGLALAGALACAAALAAPQAPRLEFTVHRLAGARPGPTVLVVGGIQGDEPGGFTAASLLATRYRVLRGRLWVVPNLNFESIVRRSRGVNGDMNRKFHRVAASDPDYPSVRRIQQIITAPEVDYVLNLHDGSGFYRARHVDRLRNPRRWGQSIVIDQERLAGLPYGDLGARARAVAGVVNRRLGLAAEAFHIKNTETARGNREMAKTLTYFAIRNAKAAAGVEASKQFGTARRALYHLAVVEAYLDSLGLEVERSFPLRGAAVRSIIDGGPRLSLYGDRIVLDMHRVRRRLAYLPLPRDGPLEFRSSSPLVAITATGDAFRVSYGNRRMTEIHAQVFDYDRSRDGVEVTVDGRRAAVRFGTVLEVGREFRVEPMAGYRVNVIGWRRAGVGDESGHPIRLRDIAPRFSIDRDGSTFRVEVYHGARFTGMFLARFAPAAARAARPVSEVAVAAPVAASASGR